MGEECRSGLEMAGRSPIACVGNFFYLLRVELPAIDAMFRYAPVGMVFCNRLTGVVFIGAWFGVSGRANESIIRKERRNQHAV